MITPEQIRMAAKGKPNESNMKSVLSSLEKFGSSVGLDRMHRQVHYLAQLMHESGSFKWDKEIWGPTPAQIRYDTRTDLGNTPEKDGDGFKYRGRGPIQVTGKANYTAFRDWCRSKGYNPPDFVKDPDSVLIDPWEGLAPIWYWTTRDLNKWADQNDIETITKKINGGKNGLAERMDYYGRLGLVVCGFAANDVSGFQTASGLDVDGDMGPKTRAAIHRALVSMSEKVSEPVRSSPVVEEKAVVPQNVEKEVRQKTSWVGGLFGAGGVVTSFGTWVAGMDRDALIMMIGLFLLSVIVILVAGEWIVRRVKSIRKEVEG